VLGHRLYVGTSLFNLLALSGSELAYGVLPLRIGYRHNLIQDDLNIEPFAELNYFPCTSLQIGAKARLKVTDWVQGSLTAAYATGSLDVLARRGLEEALPELELANNLDFSTFYLGVGLGFGDVFNTPEEVTRR
jgi:hypothetical protein